jgi:hypothetical protein
MGADLAALMRAAAADTAEGQARMWAGGDDLPLWSGAAVRVALPACLPPTVGGQALLPLGGCGLCRGSGVVVVKGKRRACWCGAGRGAR